MEPRCCTVGALPAARPGRGAQAALVPLVPGSLGGAAPLGLGSDPAEPQSATQEHHGQGPPESFKLVSLRPSPKEMRHLLSLSLDLPQFSCITLNLHYDSARPRRPRMIHGKPERPGPSVSEGNMPVLSLPLSCPAETPQVLFCDAVWTTSVISLQTLLLRLLSNLDRRPAWPITCGC